MKKLEFRHIKTKKQLCDLYLNQYSEKNIRKYINDVVKIYRPFSFFCKSISLQEALTFIELYGLPESYELSETLQKEIDNRKLKV